MVRKNLGLFSSPGDQQKQPFMQVNAYHSIWIKVAATSSSWHRLATNADEFGGENRTNAPAHL